MFSRVGQLGDSYINGQSLVTTFRKVPSQASVANWWVDLSMAAGIPTPNYYASDPLTGAVLSASRGIYHGPDQSPNNKHLGVLNLVTAAAAFVGEYKLLDYLLYYPFIDLDDTTAQTMSNPISLPRYANGQGVMAMLVAGAPTIGGGTFSFEYINQSGNPATSPVQSCSTASANIASIITSEPATVGRGSPFLRLAIGDTGIQAITGWNNIVSNGGLGTVVLVAPIASSAIYEVGTTVERQYLREGGGLPRIYEGAYLNFIMRCASSVAASALTGYATFCWG